MGTYEILTVIGNYANTFRNYRINVAGYEGYPDDNYEVIDGAEYGLFYLMWEICEQNEFDFQGSLGFFGLDADSAKSVVSKISPKPVAEKGFYYNGRNLIDRIVMEIKYHLSTSIDAKDELVKCWYQGMSAGLMIVLCEFCEVLRLDMLVELEKIYDLIGDDIYMHLGEAYDVLAG